MQHGQTPKQLSSWGKDENFLIEKAVQVSYSLPIYTPVHLYTINKKNLRSATE